MALDFRQKSDTIGTSKTLFTMSKKPQNKKEAREKNKSKVKKKTSTYNQLVSSSLIERMVKIYGPENPLSAMFLH